MKRRLCAFLCVLIIASLFVFPVSAEESANNESNTTSEEGEPTYGDGVLGWLESIADGIANLAKNIASAIGDAIVTPILDGIKAVFVPSEDYLTNKVNKLRARFSFADSIIGTAEEIFGVFEDYVSTPPKIEINLGDAESKFGYKYGGVALALDMSWYARYKGTVDAVVSAFMLGGFAWRIYHNLPSIISGMSAPVRSVPANDRALREGGA